MHHAFKIGDTEINVELSRAREGYRLHVGGQVIPFNLVGWDEAERIPASNAGFPLRSNPAYKLTINGETCKVVIATQGDNVFIHLDGEAYQLHYEHPLERLAHQAHGGAEDAIRAPMPGSLVSVAVKPGDAVTKGQTLLVMESMKMETTIISPRDGVVAAVHFDQSQTFDRDALLLTLDSALTPTPLPEGEGRSLPSPSGRRAGDEGAAGGDL